ncbi:predicted protein [Postia placenta Mad-698-R]|uniref:X-box-binding protein 1 n=1 Tax=Postia placenta MAD-698-R-SB12 TaxID=670580 RepID=A0A1X6NBC8_9APHY|nr:hypothetical protein POSPLADRAFT_1177403 [Postia placenta MAD-698-R-SB12]EED81580.1 predicted protein [Postia placenta Mad-698-R]OSX65945.1 hypothetical protein POSPLADRAFT_1177403 [Postia placenta MAD-698-R-SB12]
MKRAADPEMTLPSSPAESSQSPTPSTSELADPPRKRSRSDISPDERKEARAHRNRIAAQNSRDRRKAQFVYLERRVAELEEENRQLRAGMGLTGFYRAEEDKVEEQRERDTARDRENEELRARIKTLETGWEAVVKALAASGLPLSIPSAPPSSSLSDSSLSSQPSTSALPVLVPQPSASVFPLSPALSQAPSPRSSTPIYPLDFDDSEPTRHLARVATTDAPLLSSVSLQRLELSGPPAHPSATSIPSGQQDPLSAVDEITMDKLLREILAPSPILPAATLPSGHADAVGTWPHSQPLSESEGADPIHQAMSPATAGATPAVIASIPAGDWPGQAEMQRLLDMVPVVRPDAGAAVDADADMTDFTSALGLELNEWDFTTSTGQEIDQSQLSYIAYSFSFFSRIFSLLALFSISALSFTFSLTPIYRRREEDSDALSLLEPPDVEPSLFRVNHLLSLCSPSPLGSGVALSVVVPEVELPSSGTERTGSGPGTSMSGCRLGTSFVDSVFTLSARAGSSGALVSAMKNIDGMEKRVGVVIVLWVVAVRSLAGSPLWGVPVLGVMLGIMEGRSMEPRRRRAATDGGGLDRAAPSDLGRIGSLAGVLLVSGCFGGGGRGGSDLDEALGGFVGTCLPGICTNSRGWAAAGRRRRWSSRALDPGIALVGIDASSWGDAGVAAGKDLSSTRLCSSARAGFS